jgi:hypothetical protein
VSNIKRGKEDGRPVKKRNTQRQVKERSKPWQQADAHRTCVLKRSGIKEENIIPVPLKWYMGLIAVGCPRTHDVNSDICVRSVYERVARKACGCMRRVVGRGRGRRGRGRGRVRDRSKEVQAK